MYVHRNLAPCSTTGLRVSCDRVDIPDQSGSSRYSETILIVEPEPEARQLAAMTLHQLGYTVIVAADPQEACERFTAYRGAIDLVVTEAAMSGTNGHELGRLLRLEHPGLRVVFLAEADYARLTRQVAMRQGLTFVQRPFTGQSLAEKVRQVLDAPPAGVAGAA
jgi:two-component system, cell cycle sensor histidine kinase and response regulator CckA